MKNKTHFSLWVFDCDLHNTLLIYTSICRHETCLTYFYILLANCRGEKTGNFMMGPGRHLGRYATACDVSFWWHEAFRSLQNCYAWTTITACDFTYWLFFFFLVWDSCYYPLLGRTKSRGRCWAAIHLSHQPKLLACAVHGEVDGLDIEGKYGRRFVSLCHTHRMQMVLYHNCTSRCGNVRHPSGGG